MLRLMFQATSPAFGEMRKPNEALGAFAKPPGNGLVDERHRLLSTAYPERDAA